VIRTSPEKDGDSIRLDVPLVHSRAQLCHIDSLSMILRYLGDNYETWYIGGTSGRFFGFSYHSTRERIRIGLGAYPLTALTTFLREHGYTFRLHKRESWDDAFAILKRYLSDLLPVLVICHMGWLSYNRDYEALRTAGGVMDHYVVVTGFQDDNAVYLNDPNPDTPVKDAELPVRDFRTSWTEKLRQQGLFCPMLVVKERKDKPELKEVLVRSLDRALEQGQTGLAGLKRASEDIPELLRRGTISIRNSLGELAFFTFRVAATEACLAGKFIDYLAEELNIHELEHSAAKLTVASKCFEEATRQFMDCLQGRRQIADGADAVKHVLEGAYEAERECFVNIDRIRRGRLATAKQLTKRGFTQSTS
jgi:hypothetical protein